MSKDYGGEDGETRDKGDFSSDVADLTTWEPRDLASVYFPLELTIGIQQQMGGDLFQIQVATPEAIRTHLEEEFCFPARHMLIVMSYDWQRISRKVVELVDKCEGDEWHEIARQLSKNFYWEFEGYSRPGEGG